MALLSLSTTFFLFIHTRELAGRLAEVGTMCVVREAASSGFEPTQILQNEHNYLYLSLYVCVRKQIFHVEFLYTQYEDIRIACFT